MSDRPMNLEIASPEFFSTPFEKLRVEENEGAGRTYVLKGKRIVAVVKPKQAPDVRSGGL